MLPSGSFYNYLLTTEKVQNLVELGITEKDRMKSDNCHF